MLAAAPFLWGCAHPEARPAAPDPQSIRRDVRASHELGLQWFVNSIRENGKFVYLYDPFQDRYMEGADMVRQLMAARLLAELASENPRHLERHESSLRFILTEWYRESGDQAYVFHGGRSELGANAMALRTLVYSPLFARHEDKAKKLANGIVSLIQPDGSFVPYYVYPTRKDKIKKERYLRYYSGEAVLALAEYAEATGDPMFKASALRALDWCMKHYVDNMRANFHPAYVPWQTFAMHELYESVRDPGLVDAIFRLNDRLVDLQDTTDTIGRFYKRRYRSYGGPHASCDAVYTESLAHAYQLAVETGDRKRRQEYLAVIRLAVKNLERLQFQEEFQTLVPGRGLVTGAVRTSAGNWKIRIDNVQHTMDAYRKLLQVLPE